MLHLQKILVLGVFLLGQWAMAQSDHILVRRVTVFPVKANKEFSKVAEDAWWQIRETLTENQRFLVASRNFLVQRDVFVGRDELSPADAILLGKLLDANAMVTTFLNDRTLSMRVYEGEYGRLLWSQDLNLHPSLPVSEQIVGAGKKLIYDFIASIPYQGFVVVDPLNRTAVYKEGDKYLAKVFIGLGSELQVGDKVQMIRVYHDSIRPLFGPETVPEIFAEGHAVSLERDTAVVELDRLAKSSEIKEFTLVRLPKEFSRLRDAYAMNRSQAIRPGSGDFFAPEVTPLQEEIAERKPLVTALAFIGNLAVFLLLAF